MASVGGAWSVLLAVHYLSPAESTSGPQNFTIALIDVAGGYGTEPLRTRNRCLGAGTYRVDAMEGSGVASMSSRTQACRGLANSVKDM